MAIGVVNVVVVRLEVVRVVVDVVDTRLGRVVGLNVVVVDVVVRLSWSNS